MKSTKETAKNFRWNLKRNLERWKDCTIGKGRQKNVHNMSNHMVTDEIGKITFFDVTPLHEHQYSVVLDSTKK
jgi:hypothetical protein